MNADIYITSIYFVAQTPSFIADERRRQVL